jgi:hypothetical protein
MLIVTRGSRYRSVNPDQIRLEKSEESVTGRWLWITHTLVTGWKVRARNRYRCKKR